MVNKQKVTTMRVLLARWSYEVQSRITIRIRLVNTRGLVRKIMQA